MKLSSIHELQGSESFRRLNAGLYAMDPGTAKGAKPVRRSQGEGSGMVGPAAGVRFRVTLIQHRRRLLDGHDSLRFAVKPTVDFVTAWLGFPSDDNPRLEWRYEQHQTKGREGVLIHIETYEIPQKTD